MAIRWVSNEESIRKGEPTVLAIVETILASGVSLWIAWHFNTMTHIAVAGVVAPLFLLRTDLSTRYAVHVYNNIIEILDKMKVNWSHDGNLEVVQVAFIFAPFLAISAIFSKVRSLMRIVAGGKIYFWAIVKNFSPNTIIIYIFKSPSLFLFAKPLYFKGSDISYNFEIYSLIKDNTQMSGFVHKIVVLIVFVIMLFPIFFSTFDFRLSFIVGA